MTISPINSLLLKKDGENKWEVTRFAAHHVGVNAVSWAPAASPSSLISASPSSSSSSVAPRRLVSGGSDKLVKVWGYGGEGGKWNEEEVLRGHNDWVRDVSWAPSIGLPGQTIASASQVIFFSLSFPLSTLVPSFFYALSFSFFLLHSLFFVFVSLSLVYISSLTWGYYCY